MPRHPLVIPRVTALVATLVVTMAAASVRAQAPTGRCTIDITGSAWGRDTRLNLSKTPAGNTNFFVGGGFVNHCREQDLTLRSDSAEYYGDTKLLYLIGNVHYVEPRAKIDANRMTYWTDEGHLRAEGDVVAVTNTGTTMRGPTADYYKVVQNVRTQTMLVATSRPRLDLVQRDTITGRVSDTVHVIAEHVTTVADSLTYAGGDVHITRPDLIATGDSAFMDKGAGTARLMRGPTIEARRERPFTLTGGVIDVFSSNRRADRIVATPSGHATSQDLQLFADSIDLRLRANALERAYAFGKGRARATSPTQDIIADSLDVVLPNQRVREMRAVRDAYATAVPDSAHIRTTERDWIRGDTLVAIFDTTAAAGATPRGTARDSARTPPIRSMVATSRARAFYHITNTDTTARNRPGVNYVKGREIEIAFQNRQVHTVTVRDQAAGVYLEPVNDSSPRRTAAARGGASPGGGGAGAPSRPPVRRQPNAPRRAPGIDPGARGGLFPETEP